VLLPAPDEPTIAVIRPAGIVRLTSRSAGALSRLYANEISSSRISRLKFGGAIATGGGSAAATHRASSAITL